jgi:hypothetical protein
LLVWTFIISAVCGRRLRRSLEVGAVGGAHFAQHGAGARHDVGDAEGAADFHQLAARDDDFLAQRDGVQHQQHGGGVVVDDGGGFGAGQFQQQVFDQVVAVAALAGVDVPFQVHRPAQGFTTACTALSGSRARPRLVCSTVPVRLKTGRSGEVLLAQAGDSMASKAGCWCRRHRGRPAAGAQLGQQRAGAFQRLHAAIFGDQRLAARVRQDQVDGGRRIAPPARWRTTCSFRVEPQQRVAAGARVAGFADQQVQRQAGQIVGQGST